MSTKSRAAEEALNNTQSLKLNDFDVTRDWKVVIAPGDMYHDFGSGAYVIYNPANPQQAVLVSGAEYGGELGKFVSERGNINDIYTSLGTQNIEELRKVALSPQNYAVQKAALAGQQGDSLNNIQAPNNSAQSLYDKTYENTENISGNSTNQEKTYSLNGKTYTTTGKIPVGATLLNEEGQPAWGGSMPTSNNSTDPNIDDPKNKFSTKTGKPNPAYNPTATAESKYAPFTLSGANLKYGSQGQNVADLQNYLKSIQLYDGKIDGIFGNNTLAGVKALQQQLGVTADGVVGPKTTAALQAFQGGTQPPLKTQAGYKAPTDPSNKYNTETGELNRNYNPGSEAENNPLYNSLPPELKSLYDQLNLVLEKQQTQGQRVNPDLTISPEMTARFLDEATRELEPYYQEIIRQNKEDIGVSFQRLQQDYLKNVQREEPAFQQNLEAQDTSEADSGTAFSSGREEREKSLITGQQNRLDDIFSGVQRTASDLARTGERNIGSRAFQDLGIPSLQSFAAGRGTTSPSGSIASTGSRNLFSPTGGLFGELPAQQKTAVSSRASEFEDLERRKRILDYNAGGGGLGSTSLG